MAGYLKSRVFQEWNLLKEGEKDEFNKAIGALQDRLGTGSKVMAAQDFRHLVQEDKEKVTDFNHRLERTFRLAYGNDSMMAETRDALLLAQMQDGLQYKMMESPAVSGAVSYHSSCIAAKSEE